MYCPNCGTENAADAAFCASCGNTLHTYTSPIYQLTPTKTNSGFGLGVAALICGIISHVLLLASGITLIISLLFPILFLLTAFCVLLMFITILLSIIFGIIGIKKSKQDGRKNGMAVTGLVFGILCLCITAVLIVIGLLFLSLPLFIALTLIATPHPEETPYMADVLYTVQSLMT